MILFLSLRDFNMHPAAPGDRADASGLLRKDVAARRQLNDGTHTGRRRRPAAGFRFVAAAAAAPGGDQSAWRRRKAGMS